MAGEDGLDDIRRQQAKLDVAVDVAFGELEMVGQSLLGGVFAGEHELAPMVAEGDRFNELRIWLAGLGALSCDDEALLFTERGELGGDGFFNEVGGVGLAGWRFAFQESQEARFGELDLEFSVGGSDAVDNTTDDEVAGGGGGSLPRLLKTVSGGLPQVVRHDGLVQAFMNSAFMGDFADVERVGEDVGKVALGERAAGASTALLGAVAFAGQGFLHLLDAAKVKIQLEDVADEIGFLRVDGELTVGEIVPERHGAAHPHAFGLAGSDFIADALAGDFVGVKQLHHFGEIGQRAGEAIDFVDHDGIDFTCADIL